MPNAWMRFVIRAETGAKFVSFSESVGADSLTDALEALLQAWNEAAIKESPDNA